MKLWGIFKVALFSVLPWHSSKLKCISPFKVKIDNCDIFLKGVVRWVLTIARLKLSDILQCKLGLGENLVIACFPLNRDFPPSDTSVLIR